MPTTKKRINVTLDKETERGVQILAKQNRQSRSAVIANLTRGALEFFEDLAWAELAENRRKTHKGRYLTHEEVWAK